MTISDMVQYLNSLPVSDILDHYQVSKGSRRGHNLYYYCPWHSDTQTPNLSVHVRKNYCYCFRCNQGGKPIDIILKMENGANSHPLKGRQFANFVEDSYRKFVGYVPKPEIEQKPAEELSLKLTSADILRFCGNLSSQGLSYLNKRGIYMPQKYFLGEMKLMGLPYITIPIFYKGTLVAVKCRRNDDVSKDKLRYYNIPGSQFFHPHSFGAETARQVFFVEDSFSAISISELGFPVVSLSSGCVIQKSGEWEFYNLLFGKNIIVIPDKGESGYSLIDSMQPLGLKPAKIQECPGDYKDFNDFLMGNRKEAYKFIWDLWNES